MAAETCLCIKYSLTAVKEINIVRKVFALAVGLAGLLMTQDLLPPAGAEAASQGSSDLRDLTDLKQLQEVFNRDKGKPRLVLLLSPTCSVCYQGTRWVNDEILKKNPGADLKVYAVWFRILAMDDRSRKPKELLNDPRVTNFWDNGQVVGRWFGEHVTHPDIGVEWDAWFLYGREAVWKDAPSHQIDWGRTIIGSHEKLAERFRSVERSK